MDESSSKGELREVPLMTEKGYSHRREVLWSQMQRTFKAMQKQIRILDTLTASGDSGDPEMVYTESETLRRLYQDITNALTSLLPASRRTILLNPRKLMTRSA